MMLTPQQSLIVSVFALFFTEEDAGRLFSKMPDNADFASLLLDRNNRSKHRIKTDQIPAGRSVSDWHLPELAESRQLRQVFYAWIGGTDTAYVEGRAVPWTNIIPDLICQMIIAKAESLYSRETGSAGTAGGNSAVSVKVPGQASMFVVTSLTQQMNWEGLKFARGRGIQMPAHFDDFLVLCYCRAFAMELPRRVANLWREGPVEGEFARLRSLVWHCYHQSEKSTV